MSKLTEGSWQPQDNPVVVGFVAGAVALLALFGWRPSNDLVNTAVDILSAGVAVFTVLDARRKVTPV